MSYLNGKVIENLIVPVKCETELGTAFFISDTKLMTARHVVRAYFRSTSAPAAIYVIVNGQQLLCQGEELNAEDGPIDLALLTIMDYYAPDCLHLLKDEFVLDLSLCVYGYPIEVAMGQNIVSLQVRNRLEINGVAWNDRTLVREDKLKLNYYDGLSGSPVVNSQGQVIGVVVVQINETLSYLSIKKATNHLDSKNIRYDTNWELEDTTTLGIGRSLKICKDAVATIHDRYMPDLHQPNAKLELILNIIVDKNKADESYAKASDLIEIICSLPQKVIQNIFQDLKINEKLKADLLSANGYTLLEKIHLYIKGNQLRNMLNWEDEYRLNAAAYQLERDDFKRLRIKDIMSFCFMGKAGTGKTHNLCEFALKNQNVANIYLFFGTDFNQHESVINHIRNIVCQELNFDDFNQKLQEKNRYAIIIIDAINEGLGCTYWNSHLGALRNELNHYDHFRLIISIRTPFDKEIIDLADSNSWQIYNIEGFYDTDKAIDNYFKVYGIDNKYYQTNMEAFNNPLFLKTFCETFHSMTQKERENVTKRILFKRYVAKKNQQVTLQTDEDPELNIADQYLLKLANYSVFYAHFNSIPRHKARQYAKRLAPNRLWKKDLMHACLSANLLLDDRSLENELTVMFEYENLGDYYKAEQLLYSKMDLNSILQWIAEEQKYLSKNPHIPSQKFDTAIKALFDCWRHEGIVVTNKQQIQRKGCLYNLYYDYLVESDMPFQEFLATLMELDPDYMNLLRLIRNVDEVTLDEAIQIHNKLMAYSSISSRDIIWTHNVNQMYEIYGDEYLEMISVGENPLLEVDDNERIYLICITWMLSSSHPKFRALIIRKLTKILNTHTSLIIWLISLFEDVNDPYILAGLYCAVCGVVLPSRVEEMTTAIALHLYHHYYEQAESVPQDLIVRQWSLKIIERAYYLDSRCDCWTKIKTPFKPQSIDEYAIPDYKNIRKDYFGLQQGSIKIYNSIFSLEDFNRYVIGANNNHNSNDYFRLTESGKFEGIPLHDIMAEMSYDIKYVFGWNDKLGYLDNGKYSPYRSHNDQERIGKKFQWLAWYRVNARLMDTFRVSREQYYYSDEAKEKDLTSTPYPWNTSNISRFDPTIDVSLKYALEVELTGIEKQTIKGNDDEGWIEKNVYLPNFRYKVQDRQGMEYIMLMAYDTVRNEDGKETFLFSNACFVHQVDAEQFAEWAKTKNFYGRWMPERRGQIDFLWNDYPWTDGYKTILKEQEVWEQPSNSPVKMMLSYEAQLQEDWEGIDEKDKFLTTAYMPCKEMMEQLDLYCSEIRGIVKSVSSNEVIALNIDQGNNISGLFILKNVLEDYLKRNDYIMFYYVLGEKILRSSSTHIIMKELSAAYQYNKKGIFTEIQPMRVIEREQYKL